MEGGSEGGGREGRREEGKERRREGGKEGKREGGNKALSRFLFILQDPFSVAVAVVVVAVVPHSPTAIYCLSGNPQQRQPTAGPRPRPPALSLLVAQQPFLPPFLQPFYSLARSH